MRLIARANKCLLSISQANHGLINHRCIQAQARLTHRAVGFSIVQRDALMSRQQITTCKSSPTDADKRLLFGIYITRLEKFVINNATCMHAFKDGAAQIG